MEQFEMGKPEKQKVCLKKLLPAAITAAIALLVFILGLVVFCNAGSLSESVYVGTTYASSYSFGADFYTEMFKITYKAVDQLNNIGSGLGTGFSRVLTSLRAIARGIGVLIMSLGLLSLSRAVPALLEVLPAIDLSKIKLPQVKKTQKSEQPETAEPVSEAAPEAEMPEATEEQPASEEVSETESL